MPADVSIVVADATRLGPIRDSVPMPGRAMHFASASIGSAMASIRAYRPKVVAVDAIFAETAPGAAFLDQVDAVGIPGIKVLLVADEGDGWVTMPRSMAKVLNGSSQTAAVARALAAVSAPVPAAVREPVSSTRRAPRFLLRSPLNVAVEAGEASLVNMSVLGAQIVSLPLLRPSQKIQIALPDHDETLSVAAQVAWSMFERPRLQDEPFYRVGLEFSGSAQKELEEYRRRHCVEQPLPSPTR